MNTGASVHNASDICVLLCIGEQKLTEVEIRKRYNRLYPPFLVLATPRVAFNWGRKRNRTWVLRARKSFDIDVALKDALTKGLIKREGVVRSQDEVVVWFFSITARGREVITPKQSKDIPKKKNEK